ncbi:MAG TPA: hypothetical protein VLL98_01940 [Rickettsiales bacterium]|nr:hypothetical protein [Rickettsiales bacterium]
MKILALINISNVDDLECDSGIIFQRILSNEFLKKGIEYKIIGPNIENFRKFNNFKCEKIYTELGDDRYSSRFLFNWNSLKEIIAREKPDIIFNNQAELGSALRALLTVLKFAKTKLVTYCHYPSLWSISKEGIPELDESLNSFNLGTPILFNILSSVITSDAFIIQSNFAKNLLDKSAKYFNIKNFKNINVIQPPQDPILKNINCNINFKKDNTIFYNHRLYASYGTQEFLNFIKNFKEDECKFIFSDPMPNRSEKRNSLSNSPSFFRNIIKNMKNAVLVNGDLGREAYKNNIQHCKISFGAFRKACVWSMSAIDCMSLGVPVIARNFAAYSEFIPNELLFDKNDDGISIARHLLSDSKYLDKISSKCIKYANKYSSDIISDKFIKIFNEVLLS